MTYTAIYLFLGFFMREDPDPENENLEFFQQRVPFSYFAASDYLKMWNKINSMRKEIVFIWQFSVNSDH